MRPQERHNEKTRPLRTPLGGLPKGNKIPFMTSFPQRTTDQASPYLSRFSVLTLGVTILHDLRHEATSRFFEMGLSTEEVMRITGHKT